MCRHKFFKYASMRSTHVNKNISNMLPKNVSIGGTSSYCKAKTLVAVFFPEPFPFTLFFEASLHYIEECPLCEQLKQKIGFKIGFLYSKDL